MSDTPQTGYQVLARKYRPETFVDLVGQEAMVRTLKNAFAADRIAQAFIMTGIRGTGKTTTARIIAKGMNCIGPDGTGTPTTEPCGVNDIREIIDSVAYRAASARYKIYIIDEVHMLSTSAFNALLKTLEEPPAHVKFIFATTEIRKVPVTVLSRCQRFDLRRIEPEDMIGMLRRIADSEQAEIADDALALITRAAEGSARDATSLLDQAISHGAGETTADQVRAMLGLADRGRVMDLFEMVMKGDAAGALTELSAQYADGADPMAVLRDLAELTHWVSVVKITPDAANDPTIGPDERARGQGYAEGLGLRVLARMWQMLLKSLEEVAHAPNTMMAAEMAIIRMTHVADLPTPDELVKKLADATPPPSGPSGSPPTGGGNGGGAGFSQSTQAVARSSAGGSGASGGATALAQDPLEALSRYPTFDHVVELIRANRDGKLLMDVEAGVRLVAYQPGRITFEPSPKAPADLANRLGQRLQGWTGNRWAITLVNEDGAETIEERRTAGERAREAEARAHPLVSAVFEAFPTAKILSIRSEADIAAEAQSEALPEVEDEWDPFEED
jgi:DNA polymerase-3 subunit gamma/tau